MLAGFTFIELLNFVKMCYIGGSLHRYSVETSNNLILVELISEERQQEASQDERQQAKQEKKWHDGKGFHHERLKGTILSDGYSLEEIYEMLDKSKTFAFCVFKETTEPFRHCGWYKVFLNDLGGSHKGHLFLVTSALLVSN